MRFHFYYYIIIDCCHVNQWFNNFTKEDEHDLSLTKAANKTLDLSRSLTDHCNKLADLDVDDFLLPGEADLPDDEDIPTEVHQFALQHFY